MKSLVWIFALGYCLIGIACSHHAPPNVEPRSRVVVVEEPTKDTERKELEELLAYSQYFLGLASSEQDEECAQVKSIAGATRQTVDRLRLALVLSLRSPCEDLAQAQELFKALVKDPGAETEMINFCAYQLLQLQEIQSLRDERKTLQTEVNSAQASRMELQQKLDALTTIEKSINERKGITEATR